MVMLRPCGHAVCEMCWEELQKRNHQPACPHCRCENAVAIAHGDDLRLFHLFNLLDRRELLTQKPPLISARAIMRAIHNHELTEDQGVKLLSALKIRYDDPADTRDVDIFKVDPRNNMSPFCLACLFHLYKIQDWFLDRGLVTPHEVQTFISFNLIFHIIATNFKVFRSEIKIRHCLQIL